MAFRPNRAGFGTALALAGSLLYAGGHFAWIAQGAEVPPAADEYKVKAGLIYNLATFSYWPTNKLKDDSTPFVVGIAGKEAFDRVNKELQGNTIYGHAVVARLISDETQVTDCHILFVTRLQQERVAEMLRAASQAAVLTFGELDSFLDSGGMIRFYVTEAGRSRMEIDNDSIHEAGLRIHATTLARIVKEGIAKLNKK
jgi:hypothetical protein